MARFFRSPTWHRALVVLDQGLLSGFSFVTTLVLLRGMGLDGFGIYALMTLGWLWAFGLIQALVTQPMQTLIGSRQGRARARYLASCHRLGAWMSLIGAAISIPIVHAWGQDWLVAAGFANFLAARSLQTQLRSAAFVCGQRKVAVYTDALGQGGGFVALLLLGPKMEWDLAGVLYIQAGVWWLATIVAWWRFEGRSTRPLPARLVGRRLWRFGRWLGGMAAVRWLSSNAFTLAVAAQLGPAAVGLLRGLQSIVGVLNLILAALENTLPTGAAMHRKKAGDDAALAYLGRFAAWGWLPIAALCLGIYLGADPLLHWVLDGTVPPEARPALFAFCFLPLATLASTLYGIAYRTLQRTDRLFLWYGLLAAFIAWVAPWIVAEYGVVGAAWGISLQPAMLSLLLAWGLNPKNRLSARALAK